MAETSNHPNATPPDLTPEERALGMDADITRRDFLNAVVIGTGAALLGAAAPSARGPGSHATPPTLDWATQWTGYGGVGDYARSNGNTWDVVSAGHGIRDNVYQRAIANAPPTGEIYDLVIVGGGFSGAFAAHTFLKNTDRKRPCLILDNHPLIGGEAKRNEFVVRGQRLIGPQGSNQCGFPAASRLVGWYGDMWRDIAPPDVPAMAEFAQLPPGRRPMDFARDNYMYYAQDVSENYGFFFDTPTPRWVRNPWGHRLEGTPWPDDVKRDLLRCREEPAEPFKGDAASLDHWLDTMSYADYLTKHRRFHPEVARYVDPFLASAIGGGAGISAYVPYYLRAFFPGFDGLSPTKSATAGFPPGHKLADAPGGAYPGGCDGTMRLLVKWLNPAVIEGSRSFADIHNGRIRFDAMDRPDAPCRMRTGATVVRVVHDPEWNGKAAVVTYIKNGALHSVRARTVIWAGASWTAKHAIEHLPDGYRTAMDSFPRSPMLVVNVALDNWRALYRLGYTVCTWRGGFGFTGNLRAPMHVGDYRPPLDPDQPTLFTLYVPFNKPGAPLVDQGKKARQQMLATTYREYEASIRQQLVTLFGSAGFDPKRDIAGIILNRWGHAYVNAAPGFFFGRDGAPAPSATLRQPTGNVAFAHSELSGHQTHTNAGLEGTRAATQVLAMLRIAR